MNSLGGEVAPENGVVVPALPEALAGHACFLVNTLATRAIELFDKELIGFDLSVRAAGILLLLDAQGPTSQHLIGQQLRLERSTLSLAVDEVEADELVTRRRDPADRRHNQLQLTDRGRDAVTAAKAASDRSTDALLHGMAPEQREQLLNLLRQQLLPPSLGCERGTQPLK
jgi:DNA-binding MarR family transcriptional regulator